MSGEADTVMPGPAADELRQAVADVESALEQATINGDRTLRREVYLRLLETRLASTPDNAANGRSRQHGEPIDREFATEEQRVAAVGRILDIPAGRINELFDLRKSSPALRIPLDRVPEQNSEAVRAIALLYCAAKSGLRQEAGTAEIRRTVERYGKLDEDFCAHLDNAGGLEVRGKPESPNRKVQILFSGLEHATEVALEMLQ